MYLSIVFYLLIIVDWESCDEEEAELDDTEKAKARRYDIYVAFIHVSDSDTYIYAY